MARKKSLSALGSYKNYCQTLQKKTQKKPIDYLVLDEIYTFIGEKKNKFYVWTGIGFSSTGEKLCFFHVDSSKGLTGLLNFNKYLPLANTYYCDGNTAYPWLYGSKCIPGKGVKTNQSFFINFLCKES